MATKQERLAAIWHQRWPRCFKGRVFRTGMSMYYACPECRMIYGRENGYFTGAMIVSYILAVPLLALLSILVWLATGWRVELVILVAGLLFLPFVTAPLPSLR